jgi:hypothetical protein
MSSYILSGNCTMMAHITKVAVIENATEIWVYDPSNNTNRVLNGLLDVTAVI